jgi:hypothetical protein
LSIDVDLSGLDLGALEARVNAAMPEAVHAGGEVILAGAVAKVPVESGHLVGTGKVDDSRGGDNTVAVTFDGPYARYIHEHLDFKHPHGGQAKYLELAMIEHKDEALGEVADRIKQAM